MIQGTAYGCGSDARTLYSRVIHPTSQRIALFLSRFRSASICAIRRETFSERLRSSSGGVYPAAPADGLFRAPVAQLFLQGVDQRLLFGQALFSRKMSSEEMSFISPYFTGLFCDNQDKEIYSMVREVSSRLAVASRYLPAASPAAPA